jgi:hypothetical protein
VVDRQAADREAVARRMEGVAPIEEEHLGRCGPGIGRTIECRDQCAEPLWLGLGVVIEQANQFAVGGRDPGVAGGH